jgi:ATP-binding protein involved in chromosome partitioning
MTESQTSPAENSNDGRLTEARILECLREIKYPGFSRDIVSFGLIDAIEISGSTVTVFVQLTTEKENVSKEVEKSIRNRLSSEPGVREIHVSMKVNEPAKQAKTEDVPKPVAIPGVAKIIAVASGKGGVGKSSVAAMLALKAAKQGLKTGLLDLDIYGPSLPMMMGIDHRPKVEDKMILPLERYGLALMSIGFFIDSDTPLIWRGPMVAQAATQLLTEVAWNKLDLLVIDLPPGTGDAQLTLAQKIKLDGVVIVTTPQDLALLDAKKGVMMFLRVGVHIIGIIENMSVFVCPNCGYKSHLFGYGGGRQEASRLRVPFLGEVPLDPKLREAVDTATMETIVESDNPINQAFGDIFDQIAAQLGISHLVMKPNQA